MHLRASARKVEQFHIPDLPEDQGRASKGFLMTPPNAWGRTALHEARRPEMCAGRENRGT